MSHPKSSSTFTTDYKVRGKEFIVWGYGHPGQLSAWRIKGNHSGCPKPFCLGTFSSYCKATKIPLHHLYQASVRLPTFLLNPSPCHHFQSMWTDQGQLAKSYFLCRTSSPAPLCSSLLSSGVVLFHLLEFAHFLFPDCPSFCRKRGRSQRAATANSISLTGWGMNKANIYILKGGISLSPMTSGLACPSQGRTKTWPL